MDAWRPSTKKVYTTYLNKWAMFCSMFKVSILDPSLPQVCMFLRRLSQEGLGYGALNAARSALATILPDIGGYPMGKHPLICWLIKGAYERHPPAPKYSCFWDVNVLFAMFKSWQRNSKLSLKWLSWKLAMLLSLVTSQRGQTIVGLSLEGLDLSGPVVFRMQKLLKHNRMGDPLSTIILRPYEGGKRLCVVRTLKEYMKRTEVLRKEEKQLLISFCPPHKAISRDTFSRWIIQTLAKAGVNTDKYKSHSVRGASTSAAKRLGLSVNLIMRHAGWRNSESFAKFYDKSLDQEATQVAQTLLHNVE